MHFVHAIAYKAYDNLYDALCVKDCGYCKQLYYSEEDLNNHEEERTNVCEICGTCSIKEIPDLKYCIAIGHFKED